jgi:dTDP-3-amino-3,4,6-trideoxy-alpha-D-glucose transaminase
MSERGPHEPIPLTRLAADDGELMDELLEAVARVARGAAFIGGPEVEAFEAEWAGYCRTAHAVGVSSGTEALALALRALDVGPGDEVIVPANSFVATAEAVTLVGATPRFVDVDRATALITAEHIMPALGPRTRAVIPVHLYGRTVAMDPIVRLGRETGIAVIEDACQAHGARIGHDRAGAAGDCGCFSFYPAKNLGAWGDAGALVTDDPRLADRVRLLRSHGERPRYHHQVPGTTGRLDGIQAAVLRVKLRRLEAANVARRRAAAALTAALAGAPVRVPAPIGAGRDHVFHQYVVATAQRAALRAHLEECGIATAVHYPVAIHRTRAYASSAHPAGSLPVAEALAESICSLPMFPGLAAHEIARIGAAVHAFEPARAAA